MSDAISMRRKKTTKLLDEKNIKHIDWLPHIETDTKVKSIDEVIERFISTFVVIQVACDIRNGNDVEGARNFFQGFLDRYGLSTNNLSNDEKKVWDGVADEQTVNNVGWRYEAVYVLFWALGFVDELPFPNGICDVSQMIDVIKKYTTYDEIKDNARYRSKEELLDMADYIFCLRWASVDAYINQQEQPVGMSYSVLLERHRGINWLISDSENDFDTVSLDT